MLTFSNFSYPYISNNLSGIYEAIQKLPDNNQNLIEPQNLRDAIYTTWVNNIFKQTTASGSYYIGLDSDSASNILTNPFYFGKRNYLGNNVMTPTLLNNNTDVFFFNNKPDSATQSTIVTFLAGSPNLFSKAPFIITAATNSGLDISVINPNGNINLTAASNSNIYLNGYRFPSINGTPSIGDSLVLGNNNILNWQTSGNSFNYTNSSPSRAVVGGVNLGTTFSNINLTDLLNSMFYPNLAPSCILNVITPLGSSNRYEVGSLTSSSGITYSYTITPGTLPVISAVISGSVSITIATGSGFNTIYSGNSFTYSINNSSLATYGYTLTVRDTANLTATSTFNINTYYPYFYGMTTLYNPIRITRSVGLNSLIKNINGKSNQSLNIVGNNAYFYFMYPSYYGILNKIYDPNNFVVTSSFTYSTVTISSPNNYWNNQSYYMYVYLVNGNYLTTTNGVWQFQF